MAFCLRGLLPLCPAKVNRAPWCQAQQEAGLTQDLRQPGFGPSWVPGHAAGQSWSGFGVREGAPGVRSGPRDPVLVYGPLKALPVVRAGPGSVPVGPQGTREASVGQRSADGPTWRGWLHTAAAAGTPGVCGGVELGSLQPGELLPEAERRWSPLAPRVAQERAGQLERGQEGGPSASSRLPCRQAWRWRHEAFWAGNGATSTCPGSWGPHSAPGRPPQAEGSKLASCLNGPGPPPGLIRAKRAAQAPRLWGRGGREEESGHQAVLNFLKNTLFGFFLFLEDYMKREPYGKVSQPGHRPGRQQRLPARAGGASAPLPAAWLFSGPLSVRPSVHGASRGPTWRRRS